MMPSTRSGNRPGPARSLRRTLVVGIAAACALAAAVAAAEIRVVDDDGKAIVLR